MPPPLVLDRLQAHLGGWSASAGAGQRRGGVVPPAATPAHVQVRRELVPDKAQVDLIWGVVGMPRSSPDYHPGLLADVILAGWG